MLEPIKIKSFFFTIFLIAYSTFLVQIEMLPLVNSPEDFPWPKYSNAKKPRPFLMANFLNVCGFFPQHQT